jgi:2-iminoacetate synthase ThiH
MKQPPSQVFRIFSGNRGSVPVRGSIVEMIQRAGFDAVERDTVYDRVKRLAV